MLHRFASDPDKRLLTEALRMQKMVSGDGDAAVALAGVAQLQELAVGEVLITQGADDNDVYFVLSGAVEVRINGRRIAERAAGQHVGELALIDPSVPRSSTVSASQPTVVAKVSEPAFTAVAAQHPHLWRSIALEIGQRLRERSRFVAPPNDRPVVFIGSSSEALPVAELIRAGLQSPELEVRLWSDGVFTASSFPIEDLERQLGSADFAVLVVAADDAVVSRGAGSSAPRDNVVFELGLFMGAFTRQRTFMVVPRDLDVKIPTDLIGLTQLRYASADPGADVAAACDTLRKTMLERGAR